MALSNSTINKLASVLTSDVINYIDDDERWIEFMMEVIPDFIREKMGEIDEDLMVELSQSIMDRIMLKGINLHSCDS